MMKKPKRWTGTAVAQEAVDETRRHWMAECHKADAMVSEMQGYLAQAQRERDEARADAESWKQQNEARVADLLRVGQERDDLRTQVGALFAAIAKADDLLDRVTDSHGSRRAPTLDEAQEAVRVLSDVLTLGVVDTALSYRNEIRAKAFREAAIQAQVLASTAGRAGLDETCEWLLSLYRDLMREAGGGVTK